MQNSVVNKLADAHSQINTEKAEARHSTAEIEALCDKLRLPSFKPDFTTIKAVKSLWLKGLKLFYFCSMVV